MTRRRLGQHFLYDPAILRKIVQAAQLLPEDTVIEIGPGPGRLTKMLADHAQKVIAIEVDNALYERLSRELSGYENIELIRGDALEYPFDTLCEFKVVANIPYYITTPILFTLLKHRRLLKSMTMSVQKEVAERIVAKPGGREYGVLSIMVQYHGIPELKFVVPRGAFRPVPRVDSAVIHMDISEKPVISVADEKFFVRVVKAAFSQRRKMLSNSLKPLSKDIKGILVRAEIDPSRRAETLTIGDFARLSDLLLREGLDPSEGAAE
ncbi:MAG: 16S rRNA (adenine(1518)-N(6)/adenine(1519)-N(6))-dimethyltransferase RsmA [Thermodesulfovibrionales bacterium]|jgi:16S rRNA (adenine1518-N6/adenine1519-N6)-dimethyltransferase